MQFKCPSTVEKKTVYIETSIVSYLTARPSNDLLVAARQKGTIDWWDTQRSRFDLYASDVVIAEAEGGDPGAAIRRLNALHGIPILEATDEVVAFARALIEKGALPAKALGDSLHAAIAAVNDLDYLLTWNYRHLDNAEMKPLIRSVCAIHGFTCPEICTPQELMGEAENG